jgi:hypothetical protein
MFLLNFTYSVRCSRVPQVEDHCPKDTAVASTVTMTLIAVAARPKTRTVFACSNTEVVCSNPTGGMDVCVCSV